MASILSHHEKSHDKEMSSEEEEINGHLGLRSVSFDTTTSTTPLADTQSQGFVPLMRTNPHEKHSGESSTTATASTTTSSNPIQHMISLRDIHQGQDSQDNIFVGEVELHEKHSRENAISNPKELPEAWTSTTSTAASFATGAIVVGTVANVDSEEVSRVNPAPGYDGDDLFGDTFSTSNSGGEQQSDYIGDDEVELGGELGDSIDTPPCRVPSANEAPQKFSSFGSRSSRNPGIVLRYQYELVQDLTGIDWTIDSTGQRDGTDFLVVSVLPEVEEQILGEVLVPTLFEQCGSNGWGLRKLGGSRVVGVDMKPDDFPLPQTECISHYQDPFKSIQCHRIEGALTLYFADSSSYTALLPSITLQSLNAIKEGMENESLLSSHGSVLSLKFLDSSYSLSPIVPGGATDRSMASESSSGGKGGLAAGLVFLFLVLGIGGFLGWRRYQSNEQGSHQREYQRDVAIDVHNFADLKNSTGDDGDEEDDDASYTSNGSESRGTDATTTDDDQEDGDSHSESSDSDGIFEDGDSFDPEDLGSPSFGNMYKTKKQRRKKTKNNIVIHGMADEGSVATGATGATGLHSAASQRTVKMKNIVLPNVLDVDIPT